MNQLVELLNWVGLIVLVVSAAGAFIIAARRPGKADQKTLPRLFIELATFGSAIVVSIGLGSPAWFEALGTQKIFLLLLAFSALMHAIQYIASVVSPVRDSDGEDMNLGKPTK